MWQTSDLVGLAFRAAAEMNPPDHTEAIAFIGAAAVMGAAAAPFILPPIVQALFRRQPASTSPQSPPTDDALALAQEIGSLREQVRSLKVDRDNWHERSLLLAAVMESHGVAVPD